MTDETDWLPGVWREDKPAPGRHRHRKPRRRKIDWRVAVAIAAFPVLMVGGVRAGLWLGTMIKDILPRQTAPVVVIPGPTVTRHSSPAGLQPVPHHRHHHAVLIPGPVPAQAPATVPSPAAVLPQPVHHHHVVPVPQPTIPPSPPPSPSPAPSPSPPPSPTSAPPSPTGGVTSSG